VDGPSTSSSKTSFMANAGVGLVWPFACWGRLVTDVRYRYDGNKERQVCNSGGVSQGVSGNLIQAEGRGETEFKVTQAVCKAQGKAKKRNELSACLQPDRRVEIRATGEQPG